MASYFITSCSGATSGVADFGDLPISTGAVYALYFDNGVLNGGCYTVVSGDTEPIDVVNQFQLFESCDYCVNGVPVNVPYTLDCCDYLSGSTGPGPVIPHPEFASGMGVAIQQNAVTLGGVNGVNN